MSTRSGNLSPSLARRCSRPTNLSRPRPRFGFGEIWSELAKTRLTSARHRQSWTEAQLLEQLFGKCCKAFDQLLDNFGTRLDRWGEASGEQLFGNLPVARFCLPHLASRAAIVTIRAFSMGGRSRCRAWPDRSPERRSSGIWAGSERLWRGCGRDLVLPART